MMKMKKIMYVFVILALLLSACDPAPTDTPEPTATSAPTDTPEPTDEPATPTQETMEVDPDVIARGEELFHGADFNCDSCHGENGQGGERGPGIAGLRQEYETFNEKVTGGEIGEHDAYSADDEDAPSEEDLIAIFEFLRATSFGD
jgi:mono/diheme cytochrome c family protein